MPFISYGDDEVRTFHPYFKTVADEVLVDRRLDGTHKWVHHIKTPSNRLIPDFVLVEKGTNRWVLCVEIKRTPAAIYSTRNQIQAQGYVIQNSNRFRIGARAFFAITNLEQTILFCQKNGQPPAYCRVMGGKFDAGSFADSEPVFRCKLKVNISDILDIVLSTSMPQFDLVWPQVIEEYVNFASSSMVAPIGNDGANSPNFATVKDFFCQPLEKERRLVFLLRCLLADYLRGILEREGNPKSSTLISLTRGSVNNLPNRLATIFDHIRGVDFERLYGNADIQAYRSISDQGTKDLLRQYVDKIIDANVYRHAKDRLDTRDFVDGMLTKTHPDVDLADRGKVRTDPEVAELLSAVSLTSSTGKIVDPCCGDGMLLDAAYDRLRADGIDHNSAISSVHGYECDALLARLAFIRLALKEPATIGPTTDVSIHCENMFDLPLDDADVLLMNPPYLRYERGRVEVPEVLKQHYADRIRQVSGSNSIATTGQQNLFTYYVEYVVATSREGSTISIVLDNKWYHNQYGKRLKAYIKSKCEIVAFIEYPYQNLFDNRQIATSILVCRKRQNIPPGHQVRFIRIKDDLSNLDVQDIRRALSAGEIQNSTMSSRLVEQRQLDPSKGWKTCFGSPLRLDYRQGLPKLPSLFTFSRRGSLQKEEGGMGGLAFPWSDLKYGRKLSSQQNRELHELALSIPDWFKGYAIQNSDTPANFVLHAQDVSKQPTIEMDWQKGRPEFRTSRKTRDIIDRAMTMKAISADPNMDAFVQKLISYMSLQNLPVKKLWYGLREPVAGELIIPRKQRVGHRVFVNPFAFNPSGGQVRLSSNFISYSGVRTTGGLPQDDATKIIVAFLLSSFGQLQFEMEGYNREGCLSVEENHLDKISVINPSQLDAQNRRDIIAAFSTLPFPIPTDRQPSSVPERAALDAIFAHILAQQNGWNPDELLTEVQALLEDYMEARRR